MFVIFDICFIRSGIGIYCLGVSIIEYSVNIFFINIYFVVGINNCVNCLGISDDC